MSKANEAEKVGDGCCIYLGADMCRDRSLSPATRIILGQIRQYSKKPLDCIASNRKLAEDCGVSGNTVTTAIATLSERGLIKVEQGHGGRRTITAVVRATQELCGTEAVEITNPGTPPPKDSGEAPKNCEPSSQNLGGHLKRELNKNLREKTKIEVNASSSSVDKRATTSETRPDPDGNGAVMEWAAQAASLMRERKWPHDLRDGSTELVSLQVPVPAGASSKELAALAEVAEQTWPGCDTVLGIRQVLRAAAWTGKRRDKLQQYAGLYGSGSLGARAVLRIGGKDDSLAFARECVAGVPQPPAPVTPGTAEGAGKMLRLSYSTTASWDYPCWEPCWREAAGRCKEMGAPPELFMACAQYLHGISGCHSPLPWLANGLTFADFKQFLPLYERDRLNAWRGGRQRPSNEPAYLPGDYEICVGCRIAQAAATGHKEFTSRSCLRCAALDLRIAPGLADQVSAWKGGAAQLADLLDGLASTTANDVPPFRGSSCGVEEGNTPASFIRCAHGMSKGVVRWDEAVKVP